MNVAISMIDPTFFSFLSFLGFRPFFIFTSLLSFRSFHLRNTTCCWSYSQSNKIYYIRFTVSNINLHIHVHDHKYNTYLHLVFLFFQLYYFLQKLHKEWPSFKVIIGNNVNWYYGQVLHKHYTTPYMYDSTWCTWLLGLAAPQAAAHLVVCQLAPQAAHLIQIHLFQ